MALMGIQHGLVHFKHGGINLALDKLYSGIKWPRPGACP